MAEMLTGLSDDNESHDSSGNDKLVIDEKTLKAYETGENPLIESPQQQPITEEFPKPVFNSKDRPDVINSLPADISEAEFYRINSMGLLTKWKDEDQRFAILQMLPELRGSEETARILKESSTPYVAYSKLKTLRDTPREQNESKEQVKNSKGKKRSNKGIAGLFSGMLTGITGPFKK